MWIFEIFNTSRDLEILLKKKIKKLKGIESYSHKQDVIS